MENIQAKHIVKVLLQSFKTEKMEKFFSADLKYTYVGQSVALDSTNSIKINFKSQKSKTSKPLKAYSILLIFSLNKEEEFGSNLRVDFQKLKEQGVDKIIIWSEIEHPNQKIQDLKSNNVSLIYFKEQEFQSIDAISNFIVLENVEYSYAIVLNKLSNLLIKRLKKIFHIVLSEVAAPSYDEEYGSSKNVGTAAIMEYERKVVKDLISGYLKENNLAKAEIGIDVGCGTGRHSILASENFEKIYGFDFSPKMIHRANEVKVEKGIEHITFSVADLEFEELLYEKEFLGKVDIVIASFGMGSFIEDTAGFCVVIIHG